MHPMLTLPDLMRQSYRLAFLAIAIQMTFAARLWGLSRKVQEEAQAMAEEIPASMEVVLAPLAEAAAAQDDKADKASWTAPAEARRRRRAGRAATPEPRLN